MQCENQTVQHPTVDAKAFMNRAYELERKIQVKKEQVRMYREIALNISPNLTGMPRNPSPSQSPMANAIVKIADLEVSIKEDEQKLALIRIELLEVISEVPDISVQLLLMSRYLKDMRWEEIAKEMSYSKRHVYRIHGKALGEVDRILKDVTQCHPMSP